MKDYTQEFRQDVQKDEKTRVTDIKRYYFHEYESIKDIKRTIDEQEYWREISEKDKHQPCGDIILSGFCTFTTQAHEHKNNKYSITDYTGERIMVKPETKEVEALLKTESRLTRIIFMENHILLPSGIIIPVQKERMRIIPILYATPEKGKDQERQNTPKIPDTIPEEWNTLIIPTLEEIIV